jgi:nucleotide-binding universal stress UspA family protein
MPREIDHSDIDAVGARHDLDAIISEEVKPDDSHLVRARVYNGHPAAALLDAADGADLLVVGSRGRGGFAGVLLGSVGQYLGHHAQGPVLIMRGEADQAVS